MGKWWEAGWEEARGSSGLSGREDDGANGGRDSPRTWESWCARAGICQFGVATFGKCTNGLVSDEDCISHFLPYP